MLYFNYDQQQKKRIFPFYMKLDCICILLDYQPEELLKQCSSYTRLREVISCTRQSGTGFKNINQKDILKRKEN